MRATYLAAICLTAIAAASPVATQIFPDLPFTTSGRTIKGKSGATINYAGVNWPGAADTMLPEGLQYQSIATIVSRIKSLGMNVVRLTYAIEMIDDIYSKNPNSTMQKSLIHALGQTNGQTVYNQIIAKNPQFTASTTRLQVFNAVAKELNRQKIWVHLDNHVSKGQWCCGTYDGNAWWGDTYFSINNWQRGLAFMANHTKNWSNLASMSLRNEPREPDSNSNLVSTSYNWADWYQNVMLGANAIHSANSAPLIFFSGINYDTALTPVTIGAPLTEPANGIASTNNSVFKIASYPFSNKVVFELHNYQTGATACNQIIPGLYSSGYNAMNASDPAIKNIAPVILSEFGFQQDSTTYQSQYSQCIASYLKQIKGGFMQWVLAGSYYIREGTQDSDETWGLLNHDWSDWRSVAATQYTQPLAMSINSRS